MAGIVGGSMEMIGGRLHKVTAVLTGSKSMGVCAGGGLRHFGTMTVREEGVVLHVTTCLPACHDLRVTTCLSARPNLCRW